MSDLLPGQKFTKLLTESLRDAYDKGIERGKKREQDRIIKLLEQDEDNNYYALRQIKGEK
jgi:hypothetical protein